VDARTNPLERHGRIRRKLEDAMEFPGKHDFVRVHTPEKAAGQAETLGFCEKCLIALQRLLRPLAVVDIGVGPVPFNDIAAVVEQRVGAEQEPAVLAVIPAQSRFALSRLAGS
jgi:hypothetical protein